MDGQKLTEIGNPADKVDKIDEIYSMYLLNKTGICKNRQKSSKIVKIEEIDYNYRIPRKSTEIEKKLHTVFSQV